MAEDHADNKTNKSNWIWIPNTSYGPFTFGAHLTKTPYVGREISRQNMGGGDISVDYETLIDGHTELEFWNNKLVTVDSDRSFFQKGTECVSADFRDIKHLFGCEFTITDEVSFFFINCNELNLMVFAELDWTIRSISVGVDPDL